MNVLTSPGGVFATYDSSSVDASVSSLPAQFTARRSGVSSQRAISGVFRRTRSILNNFVRLRPNFDIPTSSPLGPTTTAFTSSTSTRMPSRQRSKTSVVTSQTSSTLEGRSSMSRVSDSRSGVSLDEMEQLTMSMFHDHNASGSIFYEALEERTGKDSSSESNGEGFTKMQAAPMVANPQSPNTLIDSSLMMKAGPSTQSLSPVMEQSETFSDMSLHEAPSAVTSALGHGTAYVTALETQSEAENSLPIWPTLVLDLGPVQPISFSAVDLQSESALPSITFTLPTPVCSQGPVLPSQTSFTPCSFLAAAHRAASINAAASTTLPSPLPIPSLPRCYHALPSGAQEGSLCEACEMQMLACRIWYQASDAGTRGTLREPFIRPGESTRMNRLVTEALGLAITGPEDHALIRDGDGSSNLLVKKSRRNGSVGGDREEQKAIEAARPAIARRLSLSDATRKLMSKGSGSMLRRMGMTRSSSEGSPRTTGGPSKVDSPKPKSRRWSEIFVPRHSGL